MTLEKDGSTQGEGVSAAQCPYCGRWLSPKPLTPPPTFSDSETPPIEVMVQQLAKILPPIPQLDHFSHLVSEHDFGPPLLYHYTSYEAAKNIIQTTSIWASDAYELRDSQEVQYPSRLLKEEIECRQRCFQKRKESLFADLWSALLEELKTPKNCYPDVFVFCLTEHRMSDRHWTEYHADTGYALGFGLPAPWKLGLYMPPEEDVDAVLRRVVYDPSLQRQMLVDVVDTFVAWFSEWAEGVLPQSGKSTSDQLPSWLVRSFAQSFKDFASRVIVSIKDPSFEHEREWRVIVAPTPKLPLEHDSQRSMNWRKTRHVASKTVKYALLTPGKDELLPLCSMIAGPDCTADSRQSVTDALRKAGYQFQLTGRPAARAEAT